MNTLRNRCRKAVLLDMDGTILDSIDAIYLGVKNVFRMSGLKPPTFEEFYTTFEVPYEKYYKENGVTAPVSVICEWYYAVSKHREQTFFDDVIPVINKLHSKGILMGVISAHHVEEVREHCARNGIDRYMCIIEGRALVKTSHIQMFCSAFDVPPHHVFYVGDTCSDMRQAHAAQVVPIGITRGRKTSVDLLTHGAQHCITNLHELIPLLSL